MKSGGSLSKWLVLTFTMGAAVVMTSTAQAAVGKAVVTFIHGSADYSSGMGAWHSLKQGMILHPGAVVRTGAASMVDLYLRQNGPTVRITQNTELALDKLNFEQAGHEVIIETSLDLRSGRIIGKVYQMAAASKYEIKTPNGVAGIRGTEYDISADGTLTVVEGEAVMAFVHNNVVTPYVVSTGETFDSTSMNVHSVAPDVLQSLQSNFEELAEHLPPTLRPTVPPAEPPVNTVLNPIISPTNPSFTGSPNPPAGGE